MISDVVRSIFLVRNGFSKFIFLEHVENRLSNVPMHKSVSSSNTDFRCLFCNYYFFTQHFVKICYYCQRLNSNLGDHQLVCCDDYYVYFYFLSPVCSPDNSGRLWSLWNIVIGYKSIHVRKTWWGKGGKHLQLLFRALCAFWNFIKMLAMLKTNSFMGIKRRRK